jgi:Na+/H+ antiporter NhaC
LSDRATVGPATRTLLAVLVLAGAVGFSPLCFAQSASAASSATPQAIELELEAPGIALAGHGFDLLVRPSSAPAAGTRFRVLARDGDTLAEGWLVEGENVVPVATPALGAQTLRVELDDVPAATATVEVRVVRGWQTLLPPLVAILLALAFRQVVVALVAGCWVGAWVAHGGPFVGALRTFDLYIVNALNDGDRITILLFSLILGGMVAVLSRSGGTVGLVQALEPYATSSRRGQIVSWLMGILIFFDDYANTLLVGNTMRPVTDRLRISREKLAYIVDSTAAPVASIALISTWIGYEVSLIDGALAEIGSDREPYIVFLQSLPYNFYPVLALVFGLLVAASRRDFGPMLTAERRAADGKLLADGATPLADFDTAALDPPPDRPRRWFNAVAPVVTVLAVTFVGLWFTGRASLAADGYVRGDAGPMRYAGDVFSAGSSLVSLLWASVAGSFVAIVLAVGQRILNLAESVAAWVNGLRSMTMAFVILTLAWSIADICSAINTRGYLIGALSDGLDPRLLPLLVFVLASLTAFATGTSWGVMGILIPLVVPTTAGLTAAAGIDPAAGHSILLASVSSVLAGAIFGDHCSPISDTTVLSSMASGCDHVDHVRTQLPYALIVAVAAMLFGYLPAGYGLSPWLCQLVSAGALAGALFTLGQRREA